MSDALPGDKGAWIRGLIEGFVASSDNVLGNADGDRVFGQPIVGYARGDDPIFEEFKRDIGAFYLTPFEAFEKAHPGSAANGDELTVISWVAPHIAQTKSDNRAETSHPSERWVRGKQFGIPFSITLQVRLIEALGKAGYEAMAPCHPSLWSEQVSEKYGHSSTWSERHAAYAAGLGTFALCDGLITPVGKAMRCASVIARIAVPPTKRPYERRTEYCLFLSDGSCGLCMARCPAGAITESGHDKEKCEAYCDEICKPYAKERFGLEASACGLCQTKVPCESGIPKGRRAKA
jgi:epoxyqueuosine reductase